MTTRRRFGKIRKLPSGRWQARYSGLDGRERTAPDTFANKTDAARFLSTVEVDIGRGQWLDPTRGAVTVKAYAEAWLSTRTVKGRPLRPRTLTDYKAVLRRYVYPSLGNLPMSSVTTERVRMWHAEVAKIGSTTVAQSYRILHAIMATATVEGTYTRNPCQIRGAGQQDTPKRPLVFREDVEALAAEMPEQLSTLILLAFWGGLRLGELLGLEFRDVELDSEAGTAVVSVERQQQEIGRKAVLGPPKADSVRKVNLSGPMVAALTSHVEHAGHVLPSARLFTRISGGQLRGWDVERYWKGARQAADLPPELANVHVHDLRHGGLTLATQSGASLAEVMRRAGQASSRAAMIYQHAAMDRDADVAARMAAVAGESKTRRTRSGHAKIIELPGQAS